MDYVIYALKLFNRLSTFYYKFKSQIIPSYSIIKVINPPPKKNAEICVLLLNSKSYSMVKVEHPGICNRLILSPPVQGCVQDRSG